MTALSEPPSDACLTCVGYRTARTISRWAPILVPIGITLVLSAGGAAATSLVRDAETRARVEQLEERRLEGAEDRRRMAAEHRAGEREYAHHRQEEADRWREIAASLARIEARLDSLESRSRRR